MKIRVVKHVLTLMAFAVAFIASWQMGASYQRYEIDRGTFPIWYALYKSSTGSEAELRVLREQCKNAFESMANVRSPFITLYNLKYVDSKIPWIGSIADNDMETLRGLFEDGGGSSAIVDQSSIEKTVRKNRVPLALRLNSE